MHKIKTLKFKPFSIKDIKPSGWLKRQLRIQADGLTGHLDEFWPDIKDSSWFGGEAEGWERAPYWLDGLMPLAYLLDDEKLIAKVEKYVDYIINNQYEDGWLGPKDSNALNPEAKDRYDIWAQFLALKMLVQYYEITSDKRVIKAVEKGLRKVDAVIDWTPLFDWGQARWFEAVISILWLYEIKPEQWLLGLVTKLEAQGFGWKSFFKSWPMKEATPKGKWNFMSHIVNNAMAIKAYALMSRINDNSSEILAVDSMIEQLDKYHGTAVGTFTGDECLAGAEPTRGTELCAIVEYMYSLEHLIQVYGDVKYSDRLEKIAFNALPGAFTRDMWAHQYDQQTNQVEASINSNMPWNTNDPDANIFGLEPHFGCCTSNYHQGWPKFVSAIWSKTNDNGVAVNVYAPSELNTEINGIRTSIKLITDYPFKNKLKFIINCKMDNEFSLYLRIPEWSETSRLNINNKRIATIKEAGTYYIINNVWAKDSVVELEFSMKPVLTSRFNNAVSINHGPLVFSLRIDEKSKIINKDKPYREFPHCDYEMYAASDWNFALNSNSDIISEEKEVDGKYPFSNENFPIELRLKGKRIPEWKKDICIAGRVPESPVNVSYGDEVDLNLVPFGCTHLRITEFPFYC